MKGIGFLLAFITIALTSCGGNDDAKSSPSATAQSSSGAAPASKSVSKRGGSITVGAESWTFVPSTQCSVYPGDVVSIAGHAKEDESVEIVIDWGGPTGVHVGQDQTDTSWHAVADSIKLTIDDKRVSGTASFAKTSYSTNAVSEGSFDIECGY
jgi:hypothetical protein